MMRLLICLIAGALFGSSYAAHAGNLVVGVNVVGVQLMSEQQQDALIEQLQKDGVRTVRTGMGEKFTRFIIQASKHGIGAEVILYPTQVSTKGGKPRPADTTFGLQWAERPITDADPGQFKVWLTAQLAPLEAAGVHLTAFELGNEINGPFFNGDFLPAQASGRVLGLSDINNPNDPEGRAIAASFRAYIQLLAALKEVRDQSQSNRKTPIISAGLADGGLPGKRPGQKLDGVGIRSTLEFLRQNGMDDFVDGYGIHIYPGADPRKPVSVIAASFVENFSGDAFAVCTSAKPCWLTEWGFNNSDLSCPINDQPRLQLVDAMRTALEQFADQGRLAAYYYYSWAGLPGQRETQGGIFRCGALTDAGKLALSPMAATSAAQASNVVVGVNIWNEGYLSKAEQDAELKQMAENGVKTIRTGLLANNVDFIINAYQHGIGAVAILFPFPGKKTWSDVTLSEIKPEQLTEKVKPLLAKLETVGVRLTALELGNEINTSTFNSDLPNPGSGRELRLSDLNNPNDSEGRAVADGYRAYIKVMAALKDLRDRSKLNQQTPIISAGLAQKLGTKQVEVNLVDTIEFLRQNGMDKLVDGYGVHVYPSGDLNRSVSARISSREEGIFAECTRSKPCWMTEWGFGNSDESCPFVDGTRVKLVQSLRSALEHFVSQGRLAGIIYYDWTEVPGKPDSWAIFRCGALTDAGKLALKPM